MESLVSITWTDGAFGDQNLVVGGPIFLPLGG